MQDVHLPLAGGETIPITNAANDRTTLLECQNPLPFLEHVTQGRWPNSIGPDTYLRGIVIPDEGAIFSLCGPLGIVADDVVRLTPERAQALLLDKIW